MTIIELINYKLEFKDDHVKFINNDQTYFYTLAIWNQNFEDYAQAVYKINPLQPKRITEWSQIKR